MGFFQFCWYPQNLIILVKVIVPHCRNPRFYRTKGIYKATRKVAQAASLDYLHSTRSARYLDAESMSKNSPLFLDNLLEKVAIDADIRRSITCYLRDHPINEFEPCFREFGSKIP